MKQKMYNNIILLGFLQLIILVCLVVIVLKRYTNRERNIVVTIACFLFFGIAYYNRDYISLIFMGAVAISILLTASTHEYLFNHYPKKFRRSIYIYEKTDFMFLPFWWYLFYILMTYSNITLYRLLLFVIK